MILVNYVIEFVYKYVFVNFLFQRVGYDFLFLQGVMVVFIVGIYVGECIIYFNVLWLVLMISDIVCFWVYMFAV